MFDRRLVVLEKNRAVAWTLLAAAVIGLALFASFLAFGFALGALGLPAAGIAAVLAFFTARENTASRPRARRVRASKEGVVSDDVVLPRAQIVSGRYQPRPPVDRSAKRRPADSSVQLFGSLGRIVFETEVESEAEGVELLSALGLDASRQRAVFRAAPPMMRSQSRSALVGIGGGVVMGLGAYLGMFGGVPLVSALMMLFVILAIMPVTLVVGRDGVLFRWLGTKRFIPMANVISIAPVGDTSIKLQLNGGREETIYLFTHKQHGGVYTQYRDAVLARIREAHESHRALGPAPDVSTIVGQAGRTVLEWKRALHALASEEAGYRRASLREEDLWRVVEDPRAGEDARAGAAMLLRRGLDDEGKARVRVAAEASASPKLRVALETALAEDPDDGAFDALDEVALRRSR